jgi:hypothetical protein
MNFTFYQFSVHHSLRENNTQYKMYICTFINIEYVRDAIYSLHTTRSCYVPSARSCRSKGHRRQEFQESGKRKGPVTLNLNLLIQNKTAYGLSIA